MLKKHLYGLLISGLFLGETIQPSVTTPQGRSVSGQIASKPRFKNKSNASKSAVKGHHSNMRLIEADVANAVSRANSHARNLGTTTGLGLIDQSVVENIQRGILDITFNPTGTPPGTKTTSIGVADSGAYGVAIDSDGNIVVAGYSYNGTYNEFAIARYTSAGILDNSFGTAGITTTAIGSGNSGAYGITIDSDGKIVLAGYYNNESNYLFAVARYTSDGDLDTSFGTAGITTTQIGSGDSGAFGVRIDSDGNIVVVGYSYNGPNYLFAVARYTSAGILDTDFGTAGITTTQIGSGNSGAFGVTIDSDGNIVLVGSLYNGSNYLFAVARYT
ncbi:MAG: hypothetical protein NTU89_00880 [Candidatus Dependentiae bacterium]|nr:hypothetical protein [Candidatus Dependentiae bacterium]